MFIHQNRTGWRKKNNTEPEPWIQPQVTDWLMLDKLLFFLGLSLITNTKEGDELN